MPYMHGLRAAVAEVSAWRATADYASYGAGTYDHVIVPRAHACVGSGEGWHGSAGQDA